MAYDLEKLREDAPEGATHYSEKPARYVTIVSNDEIYTFDPNYPEDGWKEIKHSSHHLVTNWKLSLIDLKLIPEENPSSDAIIDAIFNASISTECCVPGYEKLSDVLARAYDQASKGKGKERHAGGKPFHEQPMQVISDMFDSPVGMYFQAIKKIRESHRLPTTEAQVRELLGAINYIAGIVIFLEKEGADV